ncbi:hypothetical protein M405DRAFT_844148 [Rhizopogon salebrosus TDB-379]|nr:hypothetical protein M405DRAFT_844148 [Rhizopogon salebrosus TDB-379]
MEDGQSAVEIERHNSYTARSRRSNAAGLPPGRVGEEQVKQAIRNVAELILRDVPLRLLNTQDGKLYTHKALIMKFEESNTFHSLLTLTTTRSALEQQQYIVAVVRNFFAYITLSHRWEDDELAIKDIKEESVYKLPASRFHKSSSVEVQKSISSMFSCVRALLRSEWFRRGWTLQELLAAKVIQLYKKDWSPFLQDAPFNHKDVAEILAALASATGIEQVYLKSYSPSVEHPRMKLRWARHRVTKEKEDEAYCLMGIFGFTMTVSYGEGDNAFARLLMEIMKRTGDATLLDWVGQPSSMNSCLPSSPRYFLDDPFGISGMLNTVLAGAPRTTLSFALAAKLIWVFKRATRRARRNSSHLRLANGGGQEPNDDGSPTLADIQPLPRANGGAPQVAKSRSGQSSISANRSANFPIEGSEVPLAKLLENPPWPYILTAEIHIIVPCFVHDVHSLYFEPHSNTYTRHLREIKDLYKWSPFTIWLSLGTNLGSATIPYFLKYVPW